MMIGNEANLKEALFEFKELMDNSGIEFVLAFGALLGAYRNKRLLGWDHDLDVYIIADSYKRFVDMNIFGLLRRAYKKGFRNVRWAHEFVVDTGYIKYPQIAVLPEDKQWEAFLKIDPKWRGERFSMCWKGHNEVKNDVDKEYEHPERITIDCIFYINGMHDYHRLLYDGQQHLSKIELYGRTFNAPNNCVKYLDDYYGKNWRDVFCSYPLWMKYHETLRDSNKPVPKEIIDYMNKWRPLLKQ